MMLVVDEREDKKLLWRGWGDRHANPFWRLRPSAHNPCCSLFLPSSRGFLAHDEKRVSFLGLEEFAHTLHVVRDPGSHRAGVERSVLYTRQKLKNANQTA